MRKHIQKFDKNCESFRNYDDGINTEQTRRNYHYYLDELVRFGSFSSYDELVKLTDDQIHSLLKNWIRYGKEKGLKFKSLKTKLNSAELFFEMNKRVMYKKLLHKMLPDVGDVVGGDVPFTTEEIQSILEVATKPRDKAIIHFIASTGIRPYAIQDPVIRLKHISKMQNGCMAVKVYDQSKEGYWAFLTPEATRFLNRYLNYRKRNGEILTDESVLFKTYKNPQTKKEHLSHESIRQMLDELFKKAGIERTKIRNRYDKAIIYGFRKRFNGILKMNNNINSNIAEKLMAHQNGLDGSYFKPTRDECFKEFVKAIPELTIDPIQRKNIIINNLQDEKSVLERKIPILVEEAAQRIKEEIKRGGWVYLSQPIEAGYRQ